MDLKKLELGDQILIGPEDDLDFLDVGIQKKESDAAPKMPNYTTKVVAPNALSSTEDEKLLDNFSILVDVQNVLKKHNLKINHINTGWWRLEDKNGKEIQKFKDVNDAHNYILKNYKHL